MEQCNINVSEADIAESEYSTASWAFVLIFVPLVAVCGITCNCAFIFVVYRVKFMHSITNIYLVNLAIADSFVLLAAFVQYLGDYIVSPVYDLRFSFRSAFGCSMPNFLIYFCYYASLWTLTLVSIERYLAVCHTFWHRLISTKSRAIHMVLAVWAISLLFAGISAPYTSVTICVVSADDTMSIPRILPYCQFTCGWCAIVLYITDVLQFLVALVINVIMYIFIVKSLANSPVTDGDDLQAKSRANQTRNTVAKMLIINGVIFFICLSPFSLANIDSINNYFGLYAFSKAVIYPVGWAGRVLFLVNSAMNPLIYNATNPRYRLAFKQAFSPKGNTYQISVSKTTMQASQTTSASKV